MMKALVSYKGPAYIRINRNDLPVFTPEDSDYQIGKMYPVTEGGDAVIFAAGVMVSKSAEAAEKLKTEGITVQVVNVSTLKPLLKEEVIKYTVGKKAIITAEESVKTGGLGSAIAVLLFGEIDVPFRQVAIDDIFGTSAHSYEELLTEYKINTGDIYNAVKSALTQRRN
jgi:transketolase